MASILPVAEAPILRMSGGGMESLLPAAPPVHIAGMHGGGSLLPHVPDVPMIAMRGGGVTVASFGITLFDGEKAPDISSCASITDIATPLCESLQPFVDRRVQALLKRVGFSSRDQLKKIGCGEITRNGTQLTISFHKHAITLLSGDLTDTFAKFHEGLRRHQPDPVEKSKSDKETHGLLSWMLGSRVIEDGRFDLITFMKRMESENPVLPLKGFRRFLSYHKKVEEMDVLRYAMELYGYRTGAIANTKDIYGLILSPTIAVRRADKKFAVYNNGAVTSNIDWDTEWGSKGGFAVFEPSVSSAASASAVKISPPASITTSHGPSRTSTSPEMMASNRALALSLQAPDNPILPVKNPNAALFFSGKIEHTVTVGDTQKIGGKDYHLRGMIYHRGGDKGGHYIYFYRDPTNLAKQWIRFDDEKPPQYEARPREIDTGYVYLFERDRLNSKPDPRGIYNAGNYCWANAALQMFYHIPEYRSYIQQFDDKRSPLPRDIIDTTIIIKRIFELYTDTPTTHYTVCTLQHEQLARSLFTGKYTSQQDSSEFIQRVLLNIIAPLNDFQKENGKYRDDDLANVVYMLFMIQESSILECDTNSSLRSETYPVVTDLQLAINGPSSLDQLLTVHYASEDVTNETKEINKKPCDKINKRTGIVNLDNNKYVIIILKRFEKL